MISIVRENARLVLLWGRNVVLRRVWGYRVASSARISFGAVLDRTNPRGVVIGPYSIVTRGAVVLSHDWVRGVRRETVIGTNCFIGVNAVILPGVRIGNEVVVGAGGIVTRDVPDGCLVVGNPARVVRSIRAGPYGKILLSGERCGQRREVLGQHG